MGKRSVKSKRRKYSPEFKLSAVERVRQPGVCCWQVARELGIETSILARWQREVDARGQQAFGGSGKPRDEEVACPKRELAWVKKERDFFR